METIYWIDNVETGSNLGAANNYEEALRIQHKYLQEGIDTFITKQ